MPKHRPPQACRSRQQLHGRIADVLAERFPTMVEAEPEVMAHHYREAGTAYAASGYFERAGDRAAARSAYIEAFQGSDRGTRWLTPGTRRALNFAAQARTSYGGIALGSSSRSAFLSTILSDAPASTSRPFIRWLIASEMAARCKAV
jgi:hypothetical protein